MYNCPKSIAMKIIVLISNIVPKYLSRHTSIRHLETVNEIGWQFMLLLGVSASFVKNLIQIGSSYVIQRQQYI